MEDGREDRATRSSEAIVDSSFSLSFHPNGRCIGLAARAHSPSLSLSSQETGIGSAIFVAKLPRSAGLADPTDRRTRRRKTDKL